MPYKIVSEPIGGMKIGSELVAGLKVGNQILYRSAPAAVSFNLLSFAENSGATFDFREYYSLPASTSRLLASRDLGNDIIDITAATWDGSNVLFAAFDDTNVRDRWYSFVSVSEVCYEP